MTRMKRLLAAGAAISLAAGAALAQQSGPPMGAASGAADGGPALRSASPSNNIPKEAYDQTGKPVPKTAPTRTRPATAAEVTAGSQVKDSKGQPVGMIESVDADGAVVTTGTAKVKVPLAAFGTNGGGLVLGVTKAEFDDIVARAAATPAG